MNALPCRNLSARRRTATRGRPSEVVERSQFTIWCGDAVVVVGETGQVALRGDPGVEPLDRGSDSGRVEQSVVGWFGLSPEQQPTLS